jgi:hypothetical protein
MGYGRWDAADWAAHSTSISSLGRSGIFGRSSLDADFDPSRIARRESRDSALNPQSTAIIAAIDVTGSMGKLAEILVRTGIGIAFEELLRTRPVPDPHLLVLAIGDAWCDRAPLQATQFEADIRIAEQLRRIWLEGGGGGNSYESYNLAWWFAGARTAIDCFEKRGRKGYLFTIGDEEPTPALLRSHIAEFCGGGLEQDLDAAAALAMAERMYEVFHIVVEEGSHFRSHGSRVTAKWQEVLPPQRVIPLKDHTKLAEVMVSTIEVVEGRDKDAVAGRWSGGTALVVAEAVKGLVARRPDAPGRFVRFL